MVFNLIDEKDKNLRFDANHLGWRTIILKWVRKKKAVHPSGYNVIWIWNHGGYVGPEEIAFIRQKLRIGKYKNKVMERFSQFIKKTTGFHIY